MIMKMKPGDDDIDKIGEDETNWLENERDFNDSLETENNASNGEPEIVEAEEYTHILLITCPVKIDQLNVD